MSNELVYTTAAIVVIILFSIFARWVITRLREIIEENKRLFMSITSLIRENFERDESFEEDIYNLSDEDVRKLWGYRQLGKVGGQVIRDKLEKADMYKEVRKVMLEFEKERVAEAEEAALLDTDVKS